MVSPSQTKEVFTASPRLEGSAAPALQGGYDPDEFCEQLTRLRRMALGDLTRDTDLTAPTPQHIAWGLQYSAPSQMILMNQVRRRQGS